MLEHGATRVILALLGLLQHHTHRICTRTDTNRLREAHRKYHPRPDPRRQRKAEKKGFDNETPKRKERKDKKSPPPETKKKKERGERILVAAA